MLADQRLRSIMHGVHIQWHRLPPDLPPGYRGTRTTVQNSVAIVPPNRRKPRVKVFGDGFRGQHDNRFLAQKMIERIEHSLGIGVACNIEMRDLPQRVDTGIRAPGPCTRISSPVNPCAAASSAAWIDGPLFCRCQPT